MTIIRRVLMAWLLCGAWTAQLMAQSPSSLPPVEAFGTLPAAAEPSLSPDGKHLALIKVRNGRPVAVIYTLDPAGVAPVVMPDEDGFIVGVQWANNDRLLITINVNMQIIGDDVNPWFRTVSVDTHGQNGVTMFSNMTEARDRNYSGSSVVDLAPDDPNHIYMSLYENPTSREFRDTVFRVDVTTGEAERVLRGGPETQGFIMDGHGHVVARLDMTRHPWTQRLLFNAGDNDWKEIASQDVAGGKELEVAGLTVDGMAVVMGAIDDKNGIMGLARHDVKDGSLKWLYVDPRYDVESVIRDPWSGRVLGAVVVEDVPVYHYFDPAFTALQKGLESAFPGTNAHAVTWDADQQKVVVAVDSPRLPRAYFLLDRTTHKATLLTRTYESLRSADLGEIRPYPYRSRDGLDIAAYLTLPPGKAPKNLPTVIMPHGGPQARDQLEFDWWAQFLANRGYAVLKPNFRGSIGYGQKFEEAGYGQWGRKMQDDITDGVKKLIADGIADPKRICIVGASYGGYAALAGAAFTPDLYACAFSWAGVSDLKKLYQDETDETTSTPAALSWKLFIGDNTGELESVSPADHADQIKCPVLLMHGSDDYTVRVDQGEEMNRALQHEGKKVTFIAIKGETHYMQTTATRVRVLTELERFLKENIGN
jgi:dipeptidyl aminopeptidase/acylaminoacyl peptidase